MAARYIHHLLHDLPGVSLAALCRKRIGEGLPFATDDRDPYLWGLSRLDRRSDGRGRRSGDPSVALS